MNLTFISIKNTFYDKMDLRFFYPVMKCRKKRLPLPK